MLLVKVFGLVYLCYVVVIVVVYVLGKLGGGEFVGDFWVF